MATGNRRDKLAVARATDQRTPDEVKGSLGAALRRWADRPKPPSEYLCPVCCYVPAAKLDALKEWLATPDGEQSWQLRRALDDNIVYDPATDEHIQSSRQLRCRCEIAIEDAADKRLGVEARAVGEQVERVAWAHLPSHDGEPPKTFDNFKITAKTRETAEAGLAFGDAAARKTLVLIGVTGCGKSHVLEAIGRRLLATGIAVRYEYCPAMLERWRYASSITTDDDLYVLMTALGEVDVLLLDDFALDKPTEKMGGAITALIDTRIREGRLTVLSTNVTNPTSMVAMGWPAPLASRLFDQHTGGVWQVWSKAPDYRATGGKA